MNQILKNGNIIPVRVVLPAAGTGQRMKIDTPKQFMQIIGRPLLSYTIESFESIPWIDSIIVVVSEDNVQYVQRLVEKYTHQRVIINVGGQTRHRSIREGVYSAGKDDFDGVVIIHDGVRPFVEENSLRELVISAYEHGAAGLTRPLVSTILSLTESGFLKESLDRSKYIASEMPQAFKYDVIKGAYKQCTSCDLDYGTECLHLAQIYSNVTPKLIPGPDCLWKVTFKKDLFAAEGIIKGRKSCVIFVSSLDSSFTSPLMIELEQQLQEKNKQLSKVSYSDLTDRVLLSKDKMVSNEIIFYHNHHVSVEELKTCDNVNSSTSNLRYPGIVVHVFNVTSTAQYCESSLWLESLQQYIRQASKISSQQNTCLNALVIFSDTSDDLKKSSAIVCDLIFNKNHLYSGQTFVI